VRKEETVKLTDKTRALLTVAVGMLITLVRSVMPMHVEITPAIVILETVLELGIGVAVVWLNWGRLKEAFKNKFPRKSYITIAVGFIVVLAGVIAMQAVASVIYGLATGSSMSEVVGFDPAFVVAEAFQATFPVGMIFTQCITAPIAEEVVFRMSTRVLMKNAVLYIVVSSLLFGFIHTVSFFTLDILFYAFMGAMLAGVYLKTKDIRICIAIHMLANIRVTVIGLLGG
jgi:membrane protease YdiL (CAAX protease family)